jgi:imidazolonepropionase-like amidohydrolase
MQTPSRTLIILQAVLYCCVFSQAIYVAEAVAQSELGTPELLDNVRVVVGDGTVLENTSILIEQGIITAVAARNEIDLPENVVITDLTGRTVMPALIDAHAHLGYQSHRGWGGEYYSRENLIDNM